MTSPDIRPPASRPLETLLLRLAAILTAVGTVAFLFIGGDWRLSNPFLFPDLLVSGLLLAGAVAPARIMAPVLAAGFWAGVGVFFVAAVTYWIHGRLGPGATSGLVTSAVAGGWLLWRRLRGAA